MFTVFQSSHSMQLSGQLAAELRENMPGNPLSQQKILVQSPGMAQWIKLQLARQNGIAANLEFPLPASFLWDVYRAVLGPENVPQPVAFSKTVIQCLLMDLLPGLLENPLFTHLNEYLQRNQAASASWQLTGQLADAFDHYLVYRPDWVQDWESGGSTACHDQPWQPVLWRAIVERARQLPETSLHRSEVNQQCIDQLRSGKVDSPDHLPTHLAVFGLSSLPPQYLALLHALAGHCQVSLFQLNPSMHYWGDIQPEKQQAKKFLREMIAGKSIETIDDGHLLIGNPLLASFGQQGREWLDLLYELPGIDWRENNLEQTIPEQEPETLLQAVHFEMSNLLYAGQVEPVWMGQQLSSPYSFPENDDSVQFHSCYSEQREVEVLHDWLLKKFSDQQLTPGQVIVMIPDIGRYAPFIDAVFMRASDSQEKAIPYTVSDRSYSDELPLLNSLLFLLELPDSRRTSQEVFDFISLPAVARKFNLTAEDIDILRQVIEETGVRWGRDADRSKWSLPDNEANSWEFGIKRWLLGMAMDDSHGLFNDIKPSGLMQGEVSAAVTALLDVIELLDVSEKKLQKPKTLEQWRDLLDEFVAVFFDLDENEQPAVNHLLTAFQHKLEASQVADFNKELPREVVLEIIREMFRSPNDSFRFLDGGVTFCSLMPMRCIPFKCVCLLGMNESDFPRQVNDNVFDLSKHPENKARRGDRNSRADDRYQFLEAIMAAGDFLYLSHIGVSRRNNEALPASVLLEEFREYVSVVAGQEIIQETHSLQAFDQNNYLSGKSFEKLWLPEKITRGEVLNVENDVPESLSLSDLKRFYDHPQKAFYHQVGVDFSIQNGTLPVEEDLDVTGLYNWRVNQSAYHAICNESSFEQWQRELQASGQCVSGVLASRQPEINWANATDFYLHTANGQVFDTTEEVAIEEQMMAADLGFELQGRQIQLMGNIECQSIEGQKQLFCTRAFMQQRNIRLLFRQWLDHLVLSASGYDVLSRVYFFEEQTIYYDLPAMEKSKALNQLKFLLQNWYEGHCQLSPLVMTLGWICLEHYGEWQEKDPDTELYSFDFQGRAKTVLKSFRTDEYIDALLPENQDYRYLLTDKGFLSKLEQVLLPLFQAAGWPVEAGEYHAV